MSKQDPWFLEERALAFASVVLTRRKDVKVRPYTGDEPSINLLVEILENGRSTLRCFGVQVIGCLDLPAMQEVDELVSSRQAQQTLEPTIPFCVFLIGVRALEGVYRWEAAPVVENGRALLQRSVERAWSVLNDVGVDHLMVQMRTWSNALNGNGRPRTGGKHATTAK